MNNLVHKKINAFTLSELLIVLVITSIVIGLSLTVLSLVQKQLNFIKKSDAKNTEMQLLDRALTNDFQDHNLVYNSNENMLLCFSVRDTIKYTFKEDFVLRNTDTIRVTTYKTAVYLDGAIVKEKEIDAIALQLSKEFPSKKLFISKMKDATFYMNQHGF